MEGEDMQRLSLNTSNSIDDRELRQLELALIEKTKAGQYEEALEVVNKIVSSGKGSEVTLEIQKLLVEKKELEEEDDLSSEYSTSSESSSSSDSGPAEGTGEEAKDDAKDEEESESEDSEPELDARDTLWGQMEKRKTKKTSSTKPKNELTMSKQERTALKSKLMSELVELKQQSPYNRNK